MYHIRYYSNDGNAVSRDSSSPQLLDISPTPHSDTLVPFHGTAALEPDESVNLASLRLSEEGGTMR